MSHKRSAEGQLTRDDDGDARAHEEFVTTPQIADASEMSARRVVKVRRPEGTTAAPSAFATGSSSGFFKDAAAAASSAAPTKPTFGFNFGNGNSSVATAAPANFSFGASSAEGATKPATTGFSFGLPSAATATSTSTETPSSKESKPLFGFPTAAATAGNAKPAFAFPSPSGSAAPLTAEGEKSGGGSAVQPLTFNFGATPSSTEETAKKPAAPFSFGFTTTTTTAAPASADDGAVAEAPKPVFGAGTFNFSSAVNSFVAARTKMQAEAKDEGGATTAEAKGADNNNNNNNDDDTPDPAGFGSEVVEPTARDVLAAAPSKLYIFEKGEEGKVGRWAERGTGDAKLISQPRADNAKEHVYRLLVRSGYSLNATIKKNTFTLSKTEAKHLILLVATAEGPQTYLLKFTGPTAEANTAKFAEALAKVVEEVSKPE